MLEATPVMDWRAEASDNAGVRLEICQSPVIWQAITRLHASEGFAESFRRSTGQSLPSRPAALGSQPCAVWGGPGRWFFVSDSAAQSKPDLSRAIRDTGAICVDQSGGWLLARLSGRNRIDLLSKGLGIDLHQAVFLPGTSAMTMLNEIGVILWRPEDAPDSFMLMVRRSFARSFRSWFEVSATEFGFQVSGDTQPASKLERSIARAT